MSKKEELLQKRLNGVKNNIQRERCAKCGNCCAHGSCSVLPVDIEPFTVENVMREIESGKYCIDLEVIHCGVTLSGLHVRECGSNTIDIYKPHTRCALLGEGGCDLDDITRPAFALAFVPGDPCKGMITDADYFKMWSAEQGAMEQVIRICSGGKSSLQLMLEHFDKVAMEIYEMLLNKTKSRDYSNSYMASAVSGENLYKKVIRIANSQRTTDLIVERLVNLQGDVQTAMQDPEGHEIAERLLRFNAYGMLSKASWFASIEEKIEACLKYNKMYM